MNCPPCRLGAASPLPTASAGQGFCFRLPSGMSLAADSGVQDFLRRAHHDLRIHGFKGARDDHVHERGLLARLHLLLAKGGMGDDVRPFPDQIEMVGIIDVLRDHAIFHLRGAMMERIVVTIVVSLERLDEFCCHTGLHTKIVDVKIVSFRRKWNLSHGYYSL